MVVRTSFRQRSDRGDCLASGVIGMFGLAVRVCLAWCGVIREAGSDSIAGRLVISDSSAFMLAGVQHSFPRPWCLVLRCGGGFESRDRTSSTRPHEADRCK